MSPTNRDASPLPLKRLVAIAFIATLAALVVVRFNDVLAILSSVWEVAFPFLLGSVFAYLLNLIMVRWEAIWFPKSGNKLLRGLKRPVCLVLTLVTLMAIFAVIAFLVSDEVRDAILSLWHGLEAALTSLSGILSDAGVHANSMADLESTFGKQINELLGQLDSLAPMATALLGIGGRVASGVMSTFVGLIFALYLLADKERVLHGIQRATRLVLPSAVFERVEHIAHVANECFSKFIFGQCLEGIVLGSLCAIGMGLLGMPYAATVGLVVGVGALIPLVGAWLAAIVGALMILPVDALQAVWFIVFLLILQQIDGHFIYPHVVGSAVGVSGLWVLVAVFAGGALLGIAGVLFGVPLVATLRTLALEWADERERALKASRDGSAAA